MIPVSILYPDTPPLYLDALHRTVNELISPSGIAFELRDHKRGQGAVFWHKTVEMQVVLSGRPRAAEEFEPAIRSEFQKLDGLDWRSRLSPHRAHVALEVTTDGTPDADHFAFMLSLAQITTNVIIAADTPIGIHWRQSDQLFTPERFRQMEDMLFPLPLFVHPQLFSTGRMSEDHQVIGFHLRGAQDLIGCTMTFQEAPQPLPWLLARAYALIENIRTTGAFPASGESFGTAKGERIRITVAPDGGLSLTLMEVDGIMMLQPDPDLPVPDHVASPDTRKARPTQMAAAEVLCVPQSGDPAALLRQASERRLEMAREISDRTQKRDHVVGILVGGRSPLELPRKHRGIAVWIMVLIAIILVPVAGIAMAIYNKWRGPSFQLTGVALSTLLIAALVTSGALMQHSPAAYLMDYAGMEPLPGLESLFGSAEMTF